MLDDYVSRLKTILDAGTEPQRDPGSIVTVRCDMHPVAQYCSHCGKHIPVTGWLGVDMKGIHCSEQCLRLDASTAAESKPAEQLEARREEDDIKQQLFDACDAMLNLVWQASKHYRSTDEQHAIRQAKAAMIAAKPNWKAPPHQKSSEAETTQAEDAETLRKFLKQLEPGKVFCWQGDQFPRLVAIAGRLDTKHQRDYMYWKKAVGCPEGRGMVEWVQELEEKAKPKSYEQTMPAEDAETIRAITQRNYTATSGCSPYETLMFAADALERLDPGPTRDHVHVLWMKASGCPVERDLESWLRELREKAKNTIPPDQPLFTQDAETLREIARVVKGGFRPSRPLQVSLLRIGDRLEAMATLGTDYILKWKKNVGCPEDRDLAVWVQELREKAKNSIPLPEGACMIVRGTGGDLHTCYTVTNGRLMAASKPSWL